MIFLRTVTDESGDAIEYLWFHSQVCYSDSFRDNPVSSDGTRAGIEKGGAYPCGAESDSLDYCATCGCIVGNPLTDEGTSQLPEIVETYLGRGDSDSLTRAEEIVNEYSYAISPDLKDKVTRATMRDYMRKGI